MEERAGVTSYPWNEPVRGGYAGPEVFAHPGLDQVKAFITGQAPAPPIHYLTGMRPTEAGPGLSTFTMPASDWLICPQGFIDPTALSMLADGPLGCALQTTLPAMTPYTTAEMSMNYARLPRRGGTLTARGAVITKSRSMGLTEVRIEDAEGRLVAHGTSRCFIMDPLGPAPTTPPPMTHAAPQYATPSPYERPPQGAPVPLEEWNRRSGKEILEMHVSGELPAPPISILTGKRPVAVGEGTCSFVMPATEWLNSPFPRIEGGAIAMLADTAMSGAVQSTMPPKSMYGLLDLKVNFLRPVTADGREMRADAEVIHRGRSLAVATCRIVDAAGKAVAMATGTSSVHEGRPWSDGGSA